MNAIFSGPEAIQAQREYLKLNNDKAWTYERAVTYLVGTYGIPEQQVRDGSVPQKSLDRISQLTQNLEQPIRLLHIGNFVGLSLGHLLANCSIDAAVSIDPNLNHRGVSNPQSIVADLLHYFELDEKHMLVCGYTLEKSLSNDGHVTHNRYDPNKEKDNEQAPVHVLQNLRRLGIYTFDLVLIDGNHDPEYLRREIEEITPLLRSGSLLVLDDVDDHWTGVRDVFKGLTLDPRFTNPRCDGRVGVLTKV